MITGHSRSYSSSKSCVRRKHGAGRSECAGVREMVAEEETQAEKVRALER